jgi:hypothetical protein
MTIKNALNNILEGNLDAMRQNFSSALTTKAVEKLEERKIEIAKNYFGQMMEQVETLEEKTIASKKAEKGTKYKVKSKNADKEGSEIELRQGKRVKDRGDYDPEARAFFMKTGTYDSAEDMLRTVKEENLDEIADTPRGKEAVRQAIHRADARVVDSAINPPRSKKGKRQEKTAMKTIDRGVAVHKREGGVLDNYLKRAYGVKD